VHKVAKYLVEAAAERRRVGWEISDVLTPSQMEHVAAEINRLQRCIDEAPLLLGQIVLAAGGEVRIPAGQMTLAKSVVITRREDVETGDAIFTATLKD
jgi:hypothetical protein